MKTIKWVCRYLFFALLLGIAGIWCWQCHSTVAKYESQSNSVAFIDLMMDDYDTALEIKQEADLFGTYRTKGFIALAIIGGAVLLLILWNIFGDKLCASVKSAFKRKPKQKPAVATASAAPVQAEEPVWQQPAEPVWQQPAEPVWQEPVPEQPAPQVSVQGGYCVHCGARYEGESNFCVSCGNPVAK